MKTKIFFGFSVLFIIVLINLLFVFKIQVQIGPHGGITKQAENYKIEKIQTNDTFFAFLLDNNSQPIVNNRITGEVRFYLNDQTTADIPLKPHQSDGFTLGIDAIKYYSCRVTFTVSGKSVSAKFDNDNAIVKLKKQKP